MDIAIRQIEHLRAQLEESQDYITSLQDEASHDRKFYRGRLNGFVEKVVLFEKLSYCSGVLCERLKGSLSATNSKTISDVQEVSLL